VLFNTIGHEIGLLSGLGWHFHWGPTFRAVFVVVFEIPTVGEKNNLRCRMAGVVGDLLMYRCFPLPYLT
jgi:hypothetical protein